jgi:integrase
MPDMPRKLPLHLHRETSRHGRSVWYFRRGHEPRIRIPGEFGSVEFLAAYESALSGGKPAQRQRAPAEGTFAWGLALYRKSQAWQTGLSLATRRQRDNIFERIESTPLSESRLSAWRRGDVAAGRDKRADRPAAARHFVEALRGLFRWLLEAQIVRADPTEGVKVAKPKTEGFAVWTDDDVAKYRERWPLGGRERLAFELLLGTGLRRGDIVRIGRPHVKTGVLRIDTEKGGERVAVALDEDTLAAIAAGPTGELTFLANQKSGERRGLPLSKEVFGNLFRGWCRAAGVIGKSAHGIRKAAATTDAYDGWSDAELDAKYGWSDHKMSSLYTRSAQRERLSLAAAKRTKKGTPPPAPPGAGAGSRPEKATKSKAKK